MQRNEPIGLISDAQMKRRELVIGAIRLNMTRFSTGFVAPFATQLGEDAGRMGRKSDAMKRREWIRRTNAVIRRNAGLAPRTWIRIDTNEVN